MRKKGKIQGREDTVECFSCLKIIKDSALSMLVTG